MNIEYLSASLLPSERANSVHVMKMCNAFAQAGHAVTLQAYRCGNEDVYAYYGVEPRFAIRQLPAVGVPAGKRAARALAAHRRSRHGPRPGLYYGRDLYSLLAARRSGVPMIFETHVPPQGTAQKYMIGALLRSDGLLRVVVISDALAQRYAALYPWLPRDRIVVAHDAADEPSRGAEPPERAGPGRAGAVQAVYAGSLLPGKGAEIIAELARRLPGVDFHVLGGNTNEVARARRKHRLRNLFLLGHVPHGLVSAHLRRAHVGLLPTQRRVVVRSGTDIGEWTSPLKLFEYMAHGLPIVASALPVLGEVLTSDVNALLVPAEDIDGWTAAVERLAADDELRARLGSRARSDFRERHTWLQRGRRVLEGL